MSDMLDSKSLKFQENYELWKVRRIASWINRFINACRKANLRLPEKQRIYVCKDRMEGDLCTNPNYVSKESTIAENLYLQAIKARYAGYYY